MKLAEDTTEVTGNPALFPAEVHARAEIMES